MSFKTWQTLFKSDGTYTSPRARVIVHVGLWSLLFLFLLFVNSWLTRDSDTPALTYWLAAGNMLVLTISYYWLATLAVPLLYKSKWFVLGLHVLGVFCFNTWANYLIFGAFTTYFELTPRLRGLFQVYREAGFLGSLYNYSALLVTWSLTLSSLMIPVLAKMIKDFYEARLRVIRLQRDNYQLELNFLRAQINPHFIFNAINSVYSFLVDRDEEASYLLLKLSGLLRYSVHEAGQEKVSLEQEVAFLEGYIGIETLRQRENVVISFSCEGPLSDYQIPPLLLVTFIENAFKHGINATTRAAWVEVRLRVEPGGGLYFTVKNSKPPHPTRLPKSSGIGLVNLQRRLDLLFPKDYQLEVQNLADTFNVQLFLQLHEKQTKLSYH
ncbi:hypothetical protein GCM10027275_51250 [Rhabdobacter roseus]|uniref:Sensor histidine kinase YesM n=1 Tax=Rhabdobacter roseus TaxID=1655419 RepID=A0A840U5U5_9BACT|nr:histidine kinase [Rhabdobacter roseus]MBB5287199.1 sensor histidine kinase YesM [Rhabdobacter roseus]